MRVPPSIAIDISPLLVLNTGISYYTANLVRHIIGLRPEYLWRFFAMPERVAKEVTMKNAEQEFKMIVEPWLLPPRVTSLLLQAPLSFLLTVEKFVGTNDLYHWTNFFTYSQKRGKKILTVHDVSVFLFPEFHPLKRRLTFKAFFPRSLEQADHILTDSTSTKKDLIDHFKVPAEKITTVYLGVDASFTPVPAQEATPILDNYNLRRGEYLLFFGTLDPRKYLVRFLRAYNQFRDNHRSAIPLIMVGANGWLNQSLFTEIEKSPWKRDIRILGYISKNDLPALYSGAAAFVYPSIYEGFGLPPLEAMACGAPVITSDNSSLPEVVGDAALLVNAQNVEAIAGAMFKIVSDPSLRERLWQRSSARAKRFSCRRTAPEPLAVYERILG